MTRINARRYRSDAVLSEAVKAGWRPADRAVGGRLQLFLRRRRASTEDEPKSTGADRRRRRVTPLSPDLDEEDWRRAKAALGGRPRPAGPRHAGLLGQPRTTLKGTFTPTGAPFVKNDEICRAFSAHAERSGRVLPPGHRLPPLRRRVGDQGRQAREGRQPRSCRRRRAAWLAVKRRCKRATLSHMDRQSAGGCLVMHFCRYSRRLNGFHDAQPLRRSRRVPLRERGGDQEGVPQARQDLPSRTATRTTRRPRTSSPRLNSAYEILGDADKRAQFDRGEIDAEGKPRFQGFEGFGGGRGGAAAGGFLGFRLRRRRRPVRRAAAARGFGADPATTSSRSSSARPSARPAARARARAAAAPAAEGRGRRGHPDRDPGGRGAARPRSACGSRPAATWTWSSPRAWPTAR